MQCSLNFSENKQINQVEAALLTVERILRAKFEDIVRRQATIVRTLCPYKVWPKALLHSAELAHSTARQKTAR
nr:hypothetical transcript [Hymenolepis microstoma]